MRFKVIIDDQVYAIELPEELLGESAEFHAKLDRDMDQGWQMSRQFVERPDRLQRCQIVADKLLINYQHHKRQPGHYHVDGRVHHVAHARRDRRGQRRLRGNAEYRVALRLDHGVFRRADPRGQAPQLHL